MDDYKGYRILNLWRIDKIIDMVSTSHPVPVVVSCPCCNYENWWQYNGCMCPPQPIFVTFELQCDKCQSRFVSDPEGKVIGRRFKIGDLE